MPGSSGSTSGAPAISCARRENTEPRLQPGTAQGIDLSLRLSSLLSHSAQSPCGAGCLVAKASICSITVQVQVP